MRKAIISITLILLGLATAGCDNTTTTAPDTPSAQAGPAATLPAIETGDLEVLRQRGELRVLAMRNPQGSDYLPRQGELQANERDLLQQFAARQGLTMRMVYVDSYGELMLWLLEGKGDVIADNMTATEARKAQIAFTLPTAYVREQLIARADDPIDSKEALAGRSVAVVPSTSFVTTLERIQRQVPELQINRVDESVTTEQLIEGVAKGDYDLTVGDSNLLGNLLSMRDDVKAAFDISSVQAIAMGIRPNNPQLLQALNAFLGEQQLTSEDAAHHLDDLAAIKERGVLRVLTRNNATTYFLWRGELLGFEYELASHFAEQQGLRLEMVVPPDREQLIPWLLEGRGDIIAASLTITEQRQLEEIAFSRSYHKASEVIVSRVDDPLQDLSGLAGRTLSVRPSSSYWETLEPMQAQYGFTLIAAPEDLETEDLIAAVARGEIDLSVADSHILDIELTWRDDIRAAFPLNEPRDQGWAVRKDNPQLLAAVNSFFNKEYRGLFYNITYKKYFRNDKRILSHINNRADSATAGSLSPWDDMTRDYSGRYGFDWRLVIAQMYQESRFDPKATSWVGAQGLMQVMPRTAQELELEDLQDPETGLHAGVKYLHWLMQRFEPDLTMADRTRFALAAYNAGLGHVRDARTLASQQGWDPDIWFDNVERAMLLLSQDRYARKARHGYVRGQEPVNYVREISDRYEAYVSLTEAR